MAVKLLKRWTAIEEEEVGSCFGLYGVGEARLAVTKSEKGDILKTKILKTPQPQHIVNWNHSEFEEQKHKLFY